MMNFLKTLKISISFACRKLTVDPMISPPAISLISRQFHIAGKKVQTIDFLEECCSSSENLYAKGSK